MVLLLLATAVVMALYLLAIMPRMFNRPDLSIFDTRYFAHRGLHDGTAKDPENTLSAFERAAEEGYGIEMDVQLTKDKVPVIFHDFDLRRMCGVDRKVKDLTLEELSHYPILGGKETIPTLEEVLTMLRGRCPLIVEYKSIDLDMEICEKTAPILENSGTPYCIESFNPFILRWYKKNLPGVVRGQLSDSFLSDKQYRGKKTPLAFCLENMLTNFLSRPDFVAYNREFSHKLSRVLCRKLFHSAAAAWTVRSDTELQDDFRQFDMFIFERFLPDPNGSSAEA